ncbi:PH domain-containing protein [Parabacteroides distasonis]|uniref:PH domain-containing protein n=1 Tax=Parabacteroides distasonis TaxID=823 RepID=UPI003F98F661
MQMTHYDTISFRPHPVQFVINELPLMSVFLAVVVYGGMEDMPFGSMAAVLSALVFLILLYRYIYLRRIRYDITAEQLVCERGILLRKVDYMELYRIVDFQEKQSILQQLSGLKTVSIHSMDRNTPRLDLLGMKRGDGIVALIRERVEYNKRKKGIYEITNH